MSRTLAVFCVVLPQVASGCSSGTTSGGDAVVRDSAGVTIVENRGAAWAEGEAWTVPAEPEVRIGVVEGAVEYQLFRVGDATRLSDRRMVVLNSGTQQIRYYDPQGRHLVTAGRRGQGPGEFGYPMRVTRLAGDTVMVQDRLDRSYFGPDGAFLRRETTNMQRWSALFSPGGFAEGAFWIGDRALLAPVHQPSQYPPYPEGLFRPQMTFARVSADRARADTLGTYGGILQQFVDIGRPRRSGVVPPFAPNTSFAIDDASGRVVVADNASYQLDVYGPDGSLERLIRRDVPPEPVTPEDVAAQLDRWRAMADDPSRLARFEQEWAGMTVPKTKPAHGSRVVVDESGHVWLAARPGGDDDERGFRFSVFDPQGRYLGDVTFPVVLRVFEIGSDYVLGFYRDEDQVEFIHLYRLVKP